jgi:HlyD family secretion protein
MADVNEPPVLMVENSAVVTRGDKKIVYKIIDGKAAEIPVATGREFSGYIEIVSGLENGEQVIEKPGNEIVDGISVKAD